MTTTKELLLVYPAMKRVLLNENVNVMLTPQFYTLKKEILPMKYAYQAKKIAPSLFDGLLEEGGNYEYMVYKEKDQWVFIAYDSEHIEAFLSSKGVAPAQVSKIFFAEQAVDKFTHPLKLGESEALVVLDGNAVVVPQSALEEGESSFLVFDKRFTPQKGVSLQGASGSILSRKQAFAFGGLFLLFSALFIAEGLRYGGSQSSKEELERLYSDYPALQSSYTREEILHKYRNIDKEERAKRELVKKFSSFIFKGVTLTHLNISGDRYKTEFACVSKSVSQKLEALAKKEHLKTSKIKNSHNLIIEGTL